MTIYLTFSDDAPALSRDRVCSDGAGSHLQLLLQLHHHVDPKILLLLIHYGLFILLFIRARIAGPDASFDFFEILYQYSVYYILYAAPLYNRDSLTAGQFIEYHTLIEGLTAAVTLEHKGSTFDHPQ